MDELIFEVDKKYNERVEYDKKMKLHSTQISEPSQRSSKASASSRFKSIEPRLSNISQNE